jgi:hypothetical protein
MRPTHPLLPFLRRHRRSSLVVGLTLLGSASALSCKSDNVAEPSDPTAIPASLQPTGTTIVVGNTADLVAALSPGNAGRHILIRAGTYSLDAPVTVPDGVTLEGEGAMQFSGGLPVGFGAGAHTTLTMSTDVPGNMVTLGNGSAIRRLQIVDLADRAGAVVAVVSREPGDRVSATITESEIVNPNPNGISPAGPTGVGLVVLSLNPNLGDEPAAHEGAAISAGMVRSLIRSPAGGVGVFAFNFAALGKVSVKLDGNVVGGGIFANGGVSRPDAVHDAQVWIESHRNLYRDEYPDPCTEIHPGFNLLGGSGPPVPLPVGETARNSLRVQSVEDRLEGFANGIVAVGSRRFFPSPIAGPTTGNSTDLRLLGTKISTPSCGGAPFVSDLDLAGAFSADDALSPGDGNTLHVVMRGVIGSGSRSNHYGHSVGPSGPLAPALQGSGNRLEIVGSPGGFASTNRQIDPAPGSEYFTSGAP